MIKPLLTSAAMVAALSSPVLAQDDEPVPPTTPAQLQVQDRVAAAVFDVCLPLLNGVDAAAGWALLGVTPSAASGEDGEPLHARPTTGSASTSGPTAAASPLLMTKTPASATP